MKTVHFFAFYPHNLPKIALFAPRSSMNPGNTKSLHFAGDEWEYCAASPFFRCSISPLQISTSASLRFYSCFLMIYPYFYDEVVEYRLNPHGYSLDFVSAVDCSIFQPRIQNFQARKIIVYGRENFMLNTRTNYIPYENEVHSGKEWSVFS